MASQPAAVEVGHGGAVYQRVVEPGMIAATDGIEQVGAVFARVDGEVVDSAEGVVLADGHPLEGPNVVAWPDTVAYLPEPIADDLIKVLVMGPS